MKRSMRVTIGMFLVVITACLAVAMAEAPAADATTTPGVNATPFNWTAHPWPTDECSYVPERGYWYWSYYDFAHACVHHDGCYQRHWASKGTCDLWFYNDMIASCNALHPWYARGGCYSRAAIYYWGVYYFGRPAYDHWTYTAPMNAYA